MKTNLKINLLFALTCASFSALGFVNNKISAVEAATTSLKPGTQLSVPNGSANLNNINLKVSFTTNVNLDGANNALLVGFSASDGTPLTDDRFVCSAAKNGIVDSEGVTINFEQTPLTVGSKSLDGASFTYTFESRDFTIINSSKNVSNLVVIGQKGALISDNVSITEVKYAVKFGEETQYYSYNQIITAPDVSGSYTFDFEGHSQVNQWNGDDGSTFAVGTTKATKDINYTGIGGAKEAHNWIDVSRIAPTEYSDGVKAHQECECGAIRLSNSSTSLCSNEDIVEHALGHTHKYVASFDWSNAKNPGDKPIVKYTCSDSDKCGLTAHHMDGSQVNISEKPDSRVNSTCLLKGRVTYVASCTYEGVFASDEKVYELPVGNHNLIHHDANEATCTKSGNIEYWECSVCHDKFSDNLGKNKIETTIIEKHHTLTHVGKVEATCTENGNVEYYHCSKCNKNFSDESGTRELQDVVIFSHNSFIHHDAVEGTCIQDGNIEYWECSVCHKLYSDANGKNVLTSIASEKHHQIIYVEGLEATCEAEGHSEYYKCELCNKTFSDEEGCCEADIEILPKAHKLVHVNANPATCDQDGNVEYWFCKTCKKYFDADGLEYVDVTIRARGHRYDENGVCTVCGEHKSSPSVPSTPSLTEPSITSIQASENSQNPQRETIGCFGSIAATGVIISTLSLLGIFLINKRNEK